MSNLCFLSIQLCLFSFEHWQKMERVKYLYYFHFFQSGVPLMALMGIRLEGVVPAGILPLLLTMVRLEFSHIHLSCMPCMSEMSRHWAFRFCEIKKVCLLFLSSSAFYLADAVSWAPGPAGSGQPKRNSCRN